MATLRNLDHLGPVEMCVGEELVLELAENPTTGYRWSVQVSGDVLLELMPATYAGAGTGIGAGGRRTFRFNAMRPGTASVRATLCRSWELDHPLRDHIVSIRIGEKSWP
jgi:inhibitor of cysteine peptidase